MMERRSTPLLSLGSPGRPIQRVGPFLHPLGVFLVERRWWLMLASSRETVCQGLSNNRAGPKAAGGSPTAPGLRFTPPTPGYQEGVVPSGVVCRLGALIFLACGLGAPFYAVPSPLSLPPLQCSSHVDRVLLVIAGDFGEHAQLLGTFLAACHDIARSDSGRKAKATRGVLPCVVDWRRRSQRPNGTCS